jgi:hypothetical protein
MENKTSVYKKLSKTLGFANANDFVDNTQYSKGLLTANSSEEFEVKKLELQQDFFFQSQFDKLVKDSDTKQLQAQSLRYPANIDYQLMETYPIIAQALNLYAEESTTIGDNGKMLTVYSDNHTIKKDLENLYYNILDINSNLPFWTRNMCKYGDNFIYLLTQKDRGVVGCKQLTTLEIDREEKIVDNKVVTKFINKTINEEYALWNVGHFRLLGDDKMLPYGSSVLNPVRTIWRMLRMCEDAMLIYRATRAADRRVIKVNVGNADPADIPMLVQQAASKFKKSMIVDPATGQINYKFNPATVEQDIFIATRTESSPNPIETLPGASNMSDIADITYLRDNLFCGLGVPKAFLSFSEEGASDGGGKNLSQLDVRFARKVNRIQQSLIQELNKIAIIHLCLLGYDDNDIKDFKLSLTNPSTQSDMLKVETWTSKVDLYQKLTTSNETGIKPMSETNAKRLLFNMSDDEIMDDIKKQMVENIVGDEIKNAPLIIKRSGIFDELEIYLRKGIISADSLLNKPNENGEETPTNNEIPGMDNAEGMNVDNAPKMDNTEPPIGNIPGNIQENYIRKSKKLNVELENMIGDLLANE